MKAQISLEAMIVLSFLFGVLLLDVVGFQAVIRSSSRIIDSQNSKLYCDLFNQRVKRVQLTRESIYVGDIEFTHLQPWDYPDNFAGMSNHVTLIKIGDDCLIRLPKDVKLDDDELAYFS